MLSGGARVCFACLQTCKTHSPCGAVAEAFN